ncbi:hypothetical protein LXL04_002860 [Taraxacum kok-saghyz]
MADEQRWMRDEGIGAGKRVLLPISFFFLPISNRVLPVDLRAAGASSLSLAPPFFSAGSNRWRCSSAPPSSDSRVPTVEGQMEDLPVDKWKCQGQMDKSNHSKPTRVVGRGRDNFDSIVPVLIQFFMFCYFDSFYSKVLVVFHTFKNSVYGGAKNL